MPRRDAIVPLRSTPPGAGSKSCSEKGVEDRRSLAGSDAWRDLRRRPMFWISAALIVLFVLMAIFPQLFTSKDPNFADLIEGTASALARRLVRLRTAQGYDVYARTVYGARASIMRRHLRHAVRLVFWARSWASSPVTAAAGSTRCSGALARSSWHPDTPRWDPVPLPLPQRPIDTPFLRRRWRRSLSCIAHPRLADDHAADARQRAAGQAERLRASRPGARRLA